MKKWLDTCEETESKWYGLLKNLHVYRSSLLYIEIDPFVNYLFYIILNCNFVFPCLRKIGSQMILSSTD